MPSKKRHIKFWRYYDKWIETYKHYQVSEITFQKYKLAEKWIKDNFPNYDLATLDRGKVQRMVNKYGETHQKVTVRGFLHQLQAPLRDATYEGWINRDPTYKVHATSQVPHVVTRKMYLDENEAQRLDRVFLKLHTVITLMLDFDLRTGLRFAELLGLQLKNVDFENHTIYVKHTWNYKTKDKQGGFMPTKNKFSVRTLLVDQQALKDLKEVSKNIGPDEPLFVAAITNEDYDLDGRFNKPTNDGRKYKRIFNSTINDILYQCCIEAKVPRITIHNLRHTHASILIANGVSIQSVADRLGHADTTTTQTTYIHLLDELRQKDNGKIAEIMTGLGS